MVSETPEEVHARLRKAGIPKADPDATFVLPRDKKLAPKETGHRREFGMGTVAARVHWWPFQ